MRTGRLFLLALFILCLSQNASGKERVLVIGLDGATWNTLSPWIESGELPFLKKLVDEGAGGNLTSSIPYVSPVAWPTFSTGNMPGKHGIYGFQQCVGTGKPRIPLADSIKSKRLWEILSENGKTSVVMNIQNTYPPDEIRGVHISGVMAPNIAVEPASLKPWLKQQGYIVEGKGWMNTGKKEFLQSLYDTTEKRFDVAGKLMEREDWDFFMVLLTGTDRIQHYLWGDMEDGGEYGSAVLDYYRSIDPKIKELVEKAGPGTDVLILSDHGFGRLDRRVHVNWWLKQEGYLVTKNTWENRKSMLKIWISGFLKRTGLNEVIRKLLVRGGQDAAGYQPPKIEVDFEKSKAFTCGYYTGQIYINPSLSQKEYESVQSEIMQKLRDFKDPKTGNDVVAEVYSKQELYKTGYTREAPDILMTYAPGYWMVGSFTYPWMFEDTKRETGAHEPEGMLIAWGPRIRHGVHADARLRDVAPTILRLFGLPEEMDGEPIEEILA